jgi:peptidoglycan/LPS O-acetylase OafA/YrhL
MAAAKAPAPIPSLDGIRALSFLLVYVAHSGLEYIVPGGLGVTVFFFLSGFLITTLMRQELADTGGVSFRQFYLRRVLRILPPFYTVLVLGTVLSLVGVLGGPVFPGAVAAQVFHYINYWTVWNGYDGQVPGMGVYWSLAVEEHFYLLFPLIFVFLHRALPSPRSRALALWGICLLILAWRCVLVLGLGAHSDRTYLASDTRFDSILFGCALALVGNPSVDPERPGDRKLWLGYMAPVGVLLMTFTLVYRGAVFRETIRYSLQGLALYPLFITAVRYPDFAPFRLLNNRYLAKIGALSYTLYLVHHVALNGVRRWLPAGAVVQSVVALAISLAVAEGVSRWIERPCARLRKRLGNPAPAPRRVPVGGTP